MADTSDFPLEYEKYKEAYGNPLDGDAIKRNLRVVAGQIGRGLAEMPALPTNLYDLIDLGIQKIRGNKEDQPVLPGIGGARDWSRAVDTTANEIGSSIAGEPLKTGLLENDDPIHQLGYAGSLVFSPLPLAGAANKVFKGIKEFDTGYKIVNKFKDAAATSALIASPILPTNHPAAFMAANAVIGGGATIAIEKMASPDPAEVEQGKQIAQATVSPPAIEQFKEGTKQSLSQLDEALKLASDTAVGGYQTSVGGNKELEDAFKAAMGAGSEGWTLEDYAKAAGIAFGVGAAGMIASKVHSAKAGRVLEAFGGPDLAPNAAKSAGGVSKPDTSVLTAGQVREAQGTNASKALTSLSDDPEHIQALFEGVVSQPHGRSATMMFDGTLGGDSHVKLNVPGNVTVTKIQEVAKDVDKLQILRNALEATSETNNRLLAFRNDANNGLTRGIATNDQRLTSEYSHWLTAGDEQKYAFHKKDVKFADLENDIKVAKQDPLVASVLDDVKDISKKMLDYRLEQKGITLKEYNALLRDHPDYVPLHIEGSHMQRLKLASEAGREIVGDPLTEIFRYVNQTFKEVAHGKLQDAFITEQVAKAALGKDARSMRLIGKEVNPNDINAHNREKIIPYRDSTGTPRAREITDPTVRSALRGDAGSGALRVTEGIVKFLSYPSRFLEWATTGPASAVFGSPFPIINAAYGTSAVLMNRPVGTVAGLLDRIAQDFTKKVIGRPIGVRADPTFVVQMGVQAVQNIGAVFAKYGAKALENVATNHSIHGASAGPGTLAAMGTSLSNLYKRTMLHELESRGMRGGATPMYQTKMQTLEDVELRLSKAARASEGWAVTKDFIHDIFGAVGNAPQSAFFKHNKGRMSEELLTTRTRNVMGDPTKAGLAKSNYGKTVASGIVLSPWGGVTVQSIKRFAKAVKENPKGTTVAIAGTTVIPSIMATLYNMNLGPEYTRYQFVERTPDQAAGSIYLGIHGRPPNEGAEIHVDQIMRPFKVMTDMLFGHNFGLYDGSVFKPENQDVHNALVAGIAERYAVWGSAMKSAIGQLLPSPTPVANAWSLASGHGAVSRTYVEPATKVVENRNRGASESTSSHIDNKFFGYPVSAEMESLINSVGGQLG